ncbi:PEP-CTERM sorting domain-containing protein [Sphingomonas panacisoli]|uniref:PEP-CTERM sorting domain-containing protein n=2 Tax=Sphingomonas panacisoli TaxID=1813879 RepID=A0A5B8LM61_9SPHN|nr:PEP-CTERM sorting domain-containing protein [Sphingomonas panacisoli]
MYSTEVVRGLSEYNLTGLTSSPTAFVTFDVYKAGGLFSGVNDTPFTGPITIYAYQGNNLEDISDFQAAAVATIGTFNVSPGSTPVGSIFSFDITSVFNQAIANNWNSLGIRLQANSLTASQAWTFQDFRLTSNNQTTGGAVPEPATWAMMLLGFGAIGGTLRRRSVTTRVRYA